jgi:hypothetical protein
LVTNVIREEEASFLRTLEFKDYNLHNWKLMARVNGLKHLNYVYTLPYRFNGFNIERKRF